MSKSLDFVFDFGSPNAYFAYKALPPLLERTGATLKIVPCLLGGIFKSTGNKPPMMAYGDVPAKMAYEQLEMQRFMTRHGIHDFKFNPHFPVNTLILMRGAIAAQREGRLASYVETGLACMWEQELKMDDPEVFVQAMNDAGFDGTALLESTQDPEVKAELVQNTASAVERGVFGIPTFFVGEDMFFGKDRLQQVEEALIA